jgi:UDP-N-acetylmuramoyl-tripeptide--D-alanyl-D-alanine ligase
MEERSLQFMADASGGVILRGDPSLLLKEVRTDSRTASAGDLFVALKGERFDAHEFLSQAREKGATAAMIHRKDSRWDGPCLLVENTRFALGRLGGAYRNDFDLPIVAVGGANGKTSAKELIAAVLQRKGPTLWSVESFNNDLGVPLTLLRLSRKHHAAVLEAGTNHPGELAPLLLMIRPKFGVITSIGREHLEFFRDLEGVAREEGTMAEALPASGALFVNGDSPEMGQILKRTKARVLKIGFGPANDWRVVDARIGPEGTSFTLETKDAGYKGQYSIKLVGKHQAINAAFAIALGREFGMSRESIAGGLLECEGAKMRMQVKRLNDLVILNDAYNANPDSMGAALETLGDFPAAGRRIAVLGDMGELGSGSAEEHEGVGKKVAALGVDALFASGKFAEATAKGARLGGLQNVFESAELAEMTERLRKFLTRNDVVLVKASRSSQFERVIDELQKPGAVEKASPVK